MTASRWLGAVVRTTRPRQWPKNLLVFAAPLAGATIGRDDGLGYAVVAALAFGCASSAVYLVNDVMDAERDRRHPVKRHRPIASGALPGRHAVALAVLAACCAVAAGIAIGEPLLVAATAGYLCSSFLYSVRLKHVPFVEMLLVASGFLLRVLGGAAATHVPPSVWFLLVCSLGALGVAAAKRYTELASLGDHAIRHRPVLRWYQPRVLRAAQVVIGAMMLATYLMWASGEPGRDARLAPGQRGSAGAGAGQVRRAHRQAGRSAGRGHDHQGRPHARLRGRVAGPVLRGPLRGKLTCPAVRGTWCCWGWCCLSPSGRSWWRAICSERGAAARRIAAGTTRCRFAAAGIRVIGLNLVADRDREREARDAGHGTTLVFGYVSFLLVSYVIYAWVYGQVAGRLQPGGLRDRPGEPDAGGTAGQADPAAGQPSGGRRRDRVGGARRRGAGAPSARCSVSAARAATSGSPEAEAMAAYLTGRGFPSGRLAREDRSRTTEENLAFSKMIMDAARPAGPDGRGRGA